MLVIVPYLLLNLNVDKYFNISTTFSPNKEDVGVIFDEKMLGFIFRSTQFFKSPKSLILLVEE